MIKLAANLTDSLDRCPPVVEEQGSGSGAVTMVETYARDLCAAL
jgi:hypothetical protein